mmetsp:Transcript_26901/g.67617  ORF Transcript_26901/g.67617 Transcript_26901/m.67617 type:complete len:206 (+) Transcript_26901:73-690(+)
MASNRPKKQLLKVIILGDSGVGKTSLMNQYVNKKFSNQYKATIGADFLTKEVIIDDKLVTLQIWDTAGQERFRTITSSYYRGAMGIIIVYDVTDKESFNHVVDWMKEIDKYASDQVNKLLIGNKSDLASKKVVQYDEAKEFADSIGVKFMETSAKNSHNVEQAFQTMASEIKTRHASQPQNTRAGAAGGHTLGAGTKVNQGGCCG